MSLRFKAISEGDGSNSKEQRIDLGNGSEVVYLRRFLSSDESWRYFDYLDKHIPWTRPSVRVFGRSHVQVIINLNTLLFHFLVSFATNLFDYLLNQSLFYL